MFELQIQVLPASSSPWKFPQFDSNFLCLESYLEILVGIPIPQKKLEKFHLSAGNVNHIFKTVHPWKFAQPMLANNQCLHGFFHFCPEAPPGRCSKSRAGPAAPKNVYVFVRT